MEDDRDLLYCGNRYEWRSWLKANHDKAEEAWLVLYKKGIREGSLSLDEAVEEALCFGWVDGKAKSVDSSSYSLRFTPRRAHSVWSLSNIRRVEKLIEAGLMTEAGHERIAEAKQNGQWDLAIRIEQTNLIPSDLERALGETKGALDGYKSLTHSRKKQLLHWLLSAKKEETRQRRIDAIVEEAAK